VVFFLYLLLNYFYGTNTCKSQSENFDRFLAKFQPNSNRIVYNSETTKAFELKSASFINLDKSEIENYVCLQSYFDCFRRDGFDTVYYSAITSYNLNDSIVLILYFKRLKIASQHILESYSRKSEKKISSWILYQKYPCFSIRSDINIDGIINTKCIIEKCAGTPDFDSDSYRKAIITHTKCKILPNGVFERIAFDEIYCIGQRSLDEFIYPVSPP
jgi:hypothetical protein